MNRTTAAVALWLTATLLGCSHHNLADAEADHLLARTYHDAAVKNAIIRQHTVFEYHFIPDSAMLNPLGRRDVGILAGHFSDYSGTLNIRRGRTPVHLYRDRVNTVQRALSDAGVQVDRMQVQDGLSAGDGLTSNEVAIILKDAYGSGASGVDASSYEITMPSVE